MAKRPPTFGDFLVTVLRHSVDAWRSGEHWFALSTWLTILVLPLLVSGLFENILGDVASPFIVFFATGWLAILVLIITPYRVWRDEYVKSQEYEERMRPAFSVNYDNRSPAHRKENLLSADGGITGTKAFSIRLQIKSVSDVAVPQCAGFLTKVEYSDDGENFVERPIYEPNRLPWALEADEFIPVDVFPKVPKFLGVLSSREEGNHFLYRSNVRSFVAVNEFSEVGVYRFTVAITAANGSTKEVILFVRWNGEWDGIEAWLAENI